MTIPTFDIFPVGGLASSVVTTVWVGVLVVAFFNLRLGWVLSGLVVPGYLVPLLLVKPWVTLVILIESIVTYLIVVFLSEKISSKGNWSSLFGRDRFFALVLASILVRLFFDVLLLPSVGAWLTETYNWQFDYRSNLRSFGLIIICLIANQIWKTGIVRGVYCLIVTTAVTFIIVRFGLLIFTNFSVSNLEFMYEDI
ncbi:MAG: poly-gamma-glutamate biosynthesis protein PgsC/CapC, partial [Gammaproteobacteria bacterium]|nr:poly-gamma-glutamate biosynthesis protein PgsC/CapC [Gammaproteobacteria bacterium]